VAANELTISVCVIMYTMLYVKSGGIVGGGGTIKTILTHFTLFIFLIIVK
jgi:hypothetical protein